MYVRANPNNNPITRPLNSAPIHPLARRDPGLQRRLSPTLASKEFVLHGSSGSAAPSPTDLAPRKADAGRRADRTDRVAETASKRRAERRAETASSSEDRDALRIKSERTDEQEAKVESNNAAESKTKSTRDAKGTRKSDDSTSAKIEAESAETETDTADAKTQADALTLANAILSEQTLEGSEEPAATDKTPKTAAAAEGSELSLELLTNPSLTPVNPTVLPAEGVEGATDASDGGSTGGASAAAVKPLTMKPEAMPTDPAAQTETPGAQSKANQPTPESTDAPLELEAVVQKLAEEGEKAKPKATFDEALARVTTSEAPKPSVAEASKAVAPTPVPPEQKFAGDNVDDVVQSVKTQALQGGGQMRMRLDPPELGALEVAVKMIDGKITASFTTSNENATQLLSHNLNHLKTSLEAAGMTVDRIQVKQGPSDSNAQNNNANDSRSDGRGDGRTGAYDPHSRQGDQQRKEAVAKMWRKLAYGTDEVDLVA